jgi:hypothetical protein
LLEVEAEDHLCRGGGGAGGLELHFQEEHLYLYQQVQYPITVGAGGAGGLTPGIHRRSGHSYFQQSQLTEVEDGGITRSWNSRRIWWMEEDVDQVGAGNSSTVQHKVIQVEQDFWKSTS